MVLLLLFMPEVDPPAERHVAVVVATSLSSGCLKS